MQPCVFCNIIAGGIPATVVHRDADVVAIADMQPQAPTHLLVMPVRHAANLEAFVTGASAGAVSRLFTVVAQLGAACGASGYRAVVNTGPYGGQTVEHLHVHVLAGREMQWPPG